MRTKSRILGLGLLALSAQTLKAQFAEDAFRFSEINSNGTARFQGLGGGHVALGGDASALTANPAGIAFFSRSEISITPGYESVHSDGRYLGRTASDSKGRMNLGNLSLIIAGQTPEYRSSKWRRSVFGLSFNRQQSFQRRFAFSGLNSQSDFTDYIVDSANEKQLTRNDLNKGYYEDPATGEIRYDNIEGVYYNLYTFDPVNGGDTPPYQAAEPRGDVNQTGSYDYRGAHSQWTFAYAGNYDDKLYIGASIGFARFNSKMDKILDENYMEPVVFRRVGYWEGIDVTGNGFNATVGAIYKVIPEFQVGLTVATPTFTKLKRSLYSGGSVEPVKPDGAPTRISTTPSDFDYSQVGPFRASLGTTWFMPGQLGFVTASVDYVSYRGMSLRSSYNDDGFMEDETRYIKDVYKNVLNPKIGAEFRFQNFRARAGVAYYADPYKQKLADIKEDNLGVSGGVGYRGKRFFADAAVVYNTYKTPFSLYPRFSEPGVTTYRNVNGVLTLGFNF